MGQVIVKVAVAGAQIATEQSGMSGENGGHVKVSQATQYETDAGEPLVKMSHHILGFGAELMQELDTTTTTTKNRLEYHQEKMYI